MGPYAAPAIKMPKKRKALGNSTSLDDHAISQINVLINRAIIKAFARTEARFSNQLSSPNQDKPNFKSISDHTVGSCSVNSSSTSASNSTNVKDTTVQPSKRPGGDFNRNASSKKAKDDADPAKEAHIKTCVNRILDNLSDYEDSEAGGFLDMEFEDAEHESNIFVPPHIKSSGRFDALNIDVPPEVSINSTSAKVNVSPKPPPIIIRNFEDINIRDLRDTVKTIHGSLMKILRNSIVVYADNVEHFNQLVNIFKEKKYTFYTYTIKNQRPKILVAKGIHPETEPDEIRDELISRGYKALKVYPMFKKLKDTNGVEKQAKLPWFTISFDSTTKISEVKLVTGCCGYRVSWEAKRKLSVTQCRRCQEFGHVASACFLNYRCVKCAESHTPGTCPINAKIDESQEETRVPVKCANCGEGHVASFSGCRERELYLGKLNKHNNKPRLNTPTGQARNFVSNRIRPGVTFSDQCKLNLGEASHPHPSYSLNVNNSVHSSGSNMSEFLNLSQQLFGMNFLRLTGQISNFLIKINMVNDIAERKAMYINFICQYLN